MSPFFLFALARHYYKNVFTKKLDFPRKIYYTKFIKCIKWMKIPGEIAYCMRRRRGCAGNSQAKRTGIRQNSEKPCSIDIIDRKTAPKRQSLSWENLSGHYEGRAEDCAPFFITYESYIVGRSFLLGCIFLPKWGLSVYFRRVPTTDRRFTPSHGIYS